MNKYYSNDNFTMISYGFKKGKFNVDKKTFLDLTKKSLFLKEYAFMEVKTLIYKLFFDIDFKGHICPYITENMDHICMRICDAIVSQLNDKFVDPDLRYIFCIKNIGSGLHIYFPNILVNKDIHLMLCNSIIATLSKYDKNIIDATWNTIIDKAVCNANGIRLPFFHFNGTYYFPSFYKSTYPVPTDITKSIEICMIRSDSTNITMLKDPEFSIKTIKSINNDDPYNMHDNIDSDLYDNLANILSIRRIDDYNEWIKFILLCKKYDKRDIAINISKKSSKFDNNSMKIITNIWSKNIDIKYTISLLHYWCYTDDKEKYMNIIKKYGTENSNQIELSQEFVNFID